MEFKVGQKVRKKHWPVNIYETIMYVGNSIYVVIGINKIERIFRKDDDRLELYQEIPEHQDWVVPGKTYYLNDNCWFTPKKYDYDNNLWRGNWNNDSSTYAYMMKRDDWFETRPKPTQPIKMAPALYSQNRDGRLTYRITGILYTSEKEARECLENGRNFIRWPANENSWVEVGI